ncbi:unnamed protein product [Hapterophycus canaliculatus]
MWLVDNSPLLKTIVFSGCSLVCCRHIIFWVCFDGDGEIMAPYNWYFYVVRGVCKPALWKLSPGWISSIYWC